jgi:hypothetical protein
VELQVGDLVDVIVHRMRRAVGVMPAKCGHHGLVPVDGSRGAALLLQRLRAGLDQQIVERGHDAHHHSIARCARQDRVKRGVLNNCGLPGLEFLALSFQDPLQVGQIFIGGAQGRGASNGRLKHPADIQELILQIGAIGHHRRKGSNQPVNGKFVRKSALAVASLEQTDRFQIAQRIANRSAAHAKPLREVPLRWKRLARWKCAVQHQRSNAIGDFFGHTSFFDRGNQARVALGTRCETLDSVLRGCYSLSVNWFNHWASVPQILMSEKLFEFLTAGSPRTVSGAIEQLAIGLGSLTAIVVPWESDRNTLCMAITSTQGEGFALEHTNLGTVRLSDLGNETTRVEIIADTHHHAEQQRFGKLFARFSSELQNRFQVTK